MDDEFDTHLVAKYILEKCQMLFNDKTWATKVDCTLKFITKLTEIEKSSAAMFLACRMLEKISKPFNLFFNEGANFAMFVSYANTMIPRIDDAAPTALSERVTAMFESSGIADYKRTQKQNYDIKVLLTKHMRGDL
jgi:hypothetical protein